MYLKRFISAFAFILSSGFILSSAQPARAAQDFGNVKLGKYIHENPEEFERIRAFVAGLAEYIDDRLEETGVEAQALPEITPYTRLKMGNPATIRALIACQDQMKAFAEATNPATSRPMAFAMYNIAGQKCRMATGKMAPYFNADYETMQLWQKKMTPLLGIRYVEIDAKAVRKSLEASIDQRYANLIQGKTDTADAVEMADDNATATPEIKKTSADDAAFPLPAKPYSFKWSEMDQIRAHVSGVMKKYGLEDFKPGFGGGKDMFQGCKDFIQSPKDLKLLYMGLNRWMEACATWLGSSGRTKYDGSLKKFVSKYRDAFYVHEAKQQKANVGKLPPMPGQPYQFVPAEIEAYKNYMKVATGQSINLSYGLITSFTGTNYNREICIGTQTDNLRTDLEHPLVKSNWQGFIGKLQNCAKNIARHNKPAGGPLVAALKDYRAALQAKQSKPLFGN